MAVGGHNSIDPNKVGHRHGQHVAQVSTATTLRLVQAIGTPIGLIVGTEICVARHPAGGAGDRDRRRQSHAASRSPIADLAAQGRWVAASSRAVFYGARPAQSTMVAAAWTLMGYLVSATWSFSCGVAVGLVLVNQRDGACPARTGAFARSPCRRDVPVGAERRGDLHALLHRLAWFHVGRHSSLVHDHGIRPTLAR